MKAIQIEKYGGSEVLEIKDNVSVSVINPNQILIEVYATSLNPFDVKLASGIYKNFIPLKFPVTPGGDASGIVKEVGGNAQDFHKGDKVFGSAMMLNGGSGALAQFAVLNEKNAYLMPKLSSFEEAAALPLVASSAVQALEEHIGLKRGQKILIHGGAGGIGHIAIQVAKSNSAYVATTVYGRDKEFVESLGANEVIDYRTEFFENLLKNYDSVFDTVGGETTNKSFQVLKRGGILVSMGGEPSKELAKKFGVKVVGQNTQITSLHLKRVKELVDQKKVSVHIGKIFPLSKIKDAFDHLASGHPRGKVVVKIKN